MVNYYGNVPDIAYRKMYIANYPLTLLGVPKNNNAFCSSGQNCPQEHLVRLMKTGYVWP